MSWVTGESRNLQLKLCVTRSLFCSILPFCVKIRLSDHRRIQDHLKMTFSSMQNSSFSILRLFFFELKMLQEFFFVLSWTCSLKKRQSSAGGQIQSRQNQHHAQVSWRSSPGGIRWWNRSLHGAHIIAFTTALPPLPQYTQPQKIIILQNNILIPFTLWSHCSRYWQGSIPLQECRDQRRMRWWRLVTHCRLLRCSWLTPSPCRSS